MIGLYPKKERVTCWKSGGKSISEKATIERFRKKRELETKTIIEKLYMDKSKDAYKEEDDKSITPTVAELKVLYYYHRWKHGTTTS